ncbi:MAG: helix-turn-helix domain-containing protein, partial [bacterium]
MKQQRTSTTPPWLRRLGSRIRSARRARGLTQTDAAGPGLTKSFVSLLESGRTYPSVGTL